MKDVILDTLLDGIKLIPFLFIAFLIIELIEHKYSKKTKKIVSNSGKFGLIIGGILGAFPQCGFSVMATNLYITRIISLGTLISIYLSTSDEMLPILISEGASFYLVAKIILIKVFIGIVAGFIIDFIFRNMNKNIELDSHICDEEHCHCDHGLIKPVIKHTINTLIFIMIITFILNSLLEIVGEDNLSRLFFKHSIFGPFVASIIGLIPNCGASVILTELYLKEAISLGSSVAGLLTGSGVAILVLFKSNKNLKENFNILLIIYTIGALSGVVIELIGMML